MPRVIHFETHVARPEAAVPVMPIPGVGWLCYGKDPDGNLFGMMQADASAA